MAQETPPCNGTGWCEQCQGRGSHYRHTCHAAECEVCGGTGECPCQYDMHAHAAPACLDVMDFDEYQELKQREAFA